MQRSGSAATCLAVSMDDAVASASDSFESAIFFQVAGPESKDDRRQLRQSTGPIPVALDTDLINHDKAGVVVMRLEVYTREDNPLVGEVLFVPGEYKAHFETLDYLTRQPRLMWFFGDESFHILKTQGFSLSSTEHKQFADVLSDTLRHDALIRMTTGYDANAALSAVVSRYELRQTVEGSTGYDSRLGGKGGAKN